MNRASLPFVCFALTTWLGGCGARGVSVGADESCVVEARVAAAALRDPELAPSGCARVGGNLLANGGFEAPALDDCGDDVRFCHFRAADVPGWSTDSEARIIEIWAHLYMDVPAVEGAQYLEVDAASRDTLSQDLSVEPRQLLLWSLSHRGRTGVEGIELRIGPPDATQLQGLLSTGEEAWAEYSGLYRVGDETTTRLSIVSRSGFDEGNLVDAVLLAPVEEP
jgi:hypothetical protein